MPLDTTRPTSESVTTSAADFANWLDAQPGQGSSAAPGATLTYFTGNLAAARFNGEVPVADAALAAERAGRVFLTQRLLSRDANGRGEFAYVATKSAGRVSR